MEVTGMDPHTAMLAVELQLADTNIILDEVGATADSYAAFAVMQTALNDVLNLLHSQIFAVDILKVDCASQLLLERLVQEERQAVQDHSLARELAGLAPKHDEEQTSAFATSSSPTDSLSNDGIPKNYTSTSDDTKITINCEQDYGKILSVIGEPKISIPGPSVAVRYEGKGKGKAIENYSAQEHVTHIICVACMDRHPRFDTIELNCKRKEDVTNHAYCRTCLVDLFKASLSDTTLFPPRCCGTKILSPTVFLYYRRD